MPNILFDWQHEPLGNPLNAAVMPSFWAKNMDYKNFWHRLTNTVMNKFTILSFKYYAYDQNVYVEKYFGPGYPDVFELEKDRDLMLINSHISLNEALPVTPAVIPIAGVHIKDDDTEIPKVYIFFFI